MTGGGRGGGSCVTRLLLAARAETTVAMRDAAAAQTHRVPKEDAPEARETEGVRKRWVIHECDSIVYRCRNRADEQLKKREKSDKEARDKEKGHGGGWSLRDIPT